MSVEDEIPSTQRATITALSLWDEGGAEPGSVLN